MCSLENGTYYGMYYGSTGSNSRHTTSKRYSSLDGEHKMSLVCNLKLCVLGLEVHILLFVKKKRSRLCNEELRKQKIWCSSNSDGNLFLYKLLLYLLACTVFSCWLCCLKWCCILYFMCFAVFYFHCSSSHFKKWASSGGSLLAGLPGHDMYAGICRLLALCSWVVLLFYCYCITIIP